MQSKQSGMRKAAVYLSPEEDAMVLQESKIKRRISKQDWIAEAVRDKLKSSNSGQCAPDDPLAGLNPADRRRVEHFIRLLSQAKDDEIFRAAVDANFGLFERALK